MHRLLLSDSVVWAGATALDTRTPSGGIATREFIAYAVRGANHGKVAEIVNGALVVVGDLPGAKEGSAVMLVGVNTITAVFTARAPGAFLPTDPFSIWTHTLDVPGIWPMDFAALVRVRDVARIVRAHVPSTAPAIEPYCK